MTKEEKKLFEAMKAEIAELKSEKAEMEGKKGTAEKMEIECIEGDMDLENRMVRTLAKREDRASRAMCNRLLKDKVTEMMSCEADESGATFEDRFVANWYGTAMKNGVTSRDMLTYLKLRGEDVQKSQSVNVKLTADAKSVRSTDDFLRDGLNGDGED